MPLKDSSQHKGTIVKYTPSTFFRGINNEMLRQAFAKEGIELDIDWQNRDPQKDKSVLKAWTSYNAKETGKEEECKRLESTFNQIWTLGKAKINGKTVCCEYEKQGFLRKPLPKDFEEYGRFEVGMYLYLNEDPAVLDLAVEHVGAADKSFSDRHWVEYRIEPGDVKVTEDLKKRLENVLNVFFIQEKKGGNAKIDTYPQLYDKLQYFIARLDDQKTSIEGKLAPQDDFGDLTYIPPYEVIIRHDSREGKFSLYARSLRKNKMHALARKLICEITGKDDGYERATKPTYDMEKFAVKKYEFPTLENEGYSKGYAEQIWIRSEAGRGMEMAIKALNGVDAYSSISNSPATTQLTDAKFAVRKIRIVMLPVAGSNNKRIKFELTEKSCTHRDLTEEQIRKVDKYIEVMDVEI
jgi:hypothetical protein